MPTVDLLPRHAPRRLATAAAAKPLLKPVRHAGTNGWTSAWGTNAHGEIAGCPPARKVWRASAR